MCFLSHKVPFHEFIRIVPEIFTFFVKHEQNLNSFAEKFGELGLAVGI